MEKKENTNVLFNKLVMSSEVSWCNICLGGQVVLQIKFREHIYSRSAKDQSGPNAKATKTQLPFFNVHPLG